MKLWIDDLRPAPDGYVWCKTTNEAKMILTCVAQMHSIECKENLPTIELVDLDHDSGDFVSYGGDYIRVLGFMEENGYNYPVRIHSMNVVGRENMRAIIRRNGWKEVM